MLVVISPAKSLNKNPKYQAKTSQPLFQQEALQLVSVLKTFSVKELAKLFSISAKLAQENFSRFQEFQSKPTAKHSNPAVYLYSGDTYKGLEVDSLNANEVQDLQKSVRIISGLYGLLRPLDAIQPYRLEMSTALKIGRQKDLYAFWKDLITEQLNKDLKRNATKFLINCASQEYASVIDLKKLAVPLITPLFKEQQGKQLKMIGIMAKRARGSFARFVVQDRPKTLNDLKRFSSAGYKFKPDLSSEQELVFVRG